MVTNDVSVSSFWLVDNQLDGKKLPIAELGRYQRSISQFCQILTGKFIPVEFYDGNGVSFTDGKTIVISSEINKDHFDSVVGLALHEASHIVKTDFKYFINIKKYIDESLICMAEKKGYSRDDIIIFIKGIFNWVEDRYIDDWVYTEAIGYRGYYDSLYERYFLNDKIGEILKNEYKKPYLSSYEFRLINLMNKDTDLDILPGLREIHKLCDLENISIYTETKNRFDIATKIVEVIFKNMLPFDEEEEKKNKKNITIVISQRKFLNGDIKKIPLDKNTILKISKILFEENVSVGNFNNSNGIPSLKGSGVPKVNCILLNKLNKSVINLSSAPFLSKFPSSSNIISINKGDRLGSVLGRKLQLRRDVKDLNFLRQKHGKLENRIAYEAFLDNSSIFTRKIEEKFTKIHLHISIDSSCSMTGTKWCDALTMASSIAKAQTFVNNLEVVISFRSSTNISPYIIIAYDSRVDNFSKIKNLFPYIVSEGGTPEGLCFEAISEHIPSSSSEVESYFLNLSDGEPAMYVGGISYSGDIAFSHTKKQIKNMISKGIKVLSYFISTNNKKDMENFKKMYGSDSHFIDVNSIVQIAKSLNERFLKK